MKIVPPFTGPRHLCELLFASHEPTNNNNEDQNNSIPVILIPDSIISYLL